MRQMGFSRHAVLEANTVQNFNECCQIICNDLELSHDVEHFTPATFLRALQRVEARAIVSVDELDDLPLKSDIQQSFAKFAKAASNQAHSLGVKFIFSGVGADAHELFHGHMSSHRNFPQILLRSLHEADFEQFLGRATKLLGVEMPLQIGRALASEAAGFPYYVHQVGFHMFAALAQDSSAKSLLDRHLEEGRDRAFEESFSHYLKRYKFTIYKLSPIEKAILAEIVRYRRPHCPYTDIEERSCLSAKASLEDVKGAFRSLVDKQYIAYRIGDKTIALRDALLKPFLMSKLQIAGRADLRRRRTPNSEGQLDLL
jgi:hypothetical protein